MKWAAVATVVLLPLLVYFCAKFGAYGYFRGKDLASNQKKQQDKGEKNG